MHSLKKITVVSIILSCFTLVAGDKHNIEIRPYNHAQDWSAASAIISAEKLFLDEQVYVDAYYKKVLQEESERSKSWITGCKNDEVIALCNHSFVEGSDSGYINELFIKEDMNNAEVYCAVVDHICNFFRQKNMYVIAIVLSGKDTFKKALLESKGFFESRNLFSSYSDSSVFTHSFVLQKYLGINSQ